MMVGYLLFMSTFLVAKNVAALLFLSFLYLLRFIIVFFRAGSIMGKSKARVRVSCRTVQKLANVKFNVYRL